MCDRECARRHVYVCTCARAIAFVMTSIPLKEITRARERERFRRSTRVFLCPPISLCASVLMCA